MGALVGSHVRVINMPTRETPGPLVDCNRALLLEVKSASIIIENPKTLEKFELSKATASVGENYVPQTYTYAQLLQFRLKAYPVVSFAGAIALLGIGTLAFRKRHTPKTVEEPTYLANRVNYRKSLPAIEVEVAPSEMPSENQDASCVEDLMFPRLPQANQSK
jgi:hypothetical protein